MSQTPRIFAALATGPMTARDLREKLHLSPAQMGKYLSRLAASPRIIHIAGYDRTSGGKAALYGLGNGPDAVFVRKENMPKVSRLEVQLIRTRKALALPRTGAELQAILHRSKPAIQNYLSTLRAAKEVYIKEWREMETTIMYAVPVYALGSKADAKNPKRHAKRKWAQLKADPDAHAVYKARKACPGFGKSSVQEATEHLFSVGTLAMNEYVKPIEHVSIPQQVYQYVVDCPGCTSRDIIADLDMRPQTVRMALKRFQQQGKLVTSGAEPSGLKLWYLPNAPVTVKEKFVAPKQETVTSWPALTIPKQNIFSALGL